MRRCKGIAKTARLGKLVKIVTVGLTRYSTDVVLPSLVRCLERLPNLHTFQAFHANSPMTIPLKKVLEGKLFPRVRKVILPSCAHEILRTLPNVTSITCNENTGGKLITAIAAGCPDVNILRRIEADPAILKLSSSQYQCKHLLDQLREHVSLNILYLMGLVKAAPNIRELHLIVRDPNWESNKIKVIKREHIKNLSTLTDLSLIELDVSATAKTTKERIEAAIEVLKKESRERRKNIGCTSK